VESGERAPYCKHVGDDPEVSTLCVPLLAQGEALGLLHLRGLGGGSEAWTSGTEQLALNTAEHLALGLANLRLQERLRRQALRDPLTGLYNRRYLEDQFKRELRRAERRGSAVSVLMLDLDHFKQINDTYGHTGGDRVLVAVADLMRRHVRGEDIVTRYGGEEFAILLVDASLEDALRVGEILRSAVQMLSVSVQGVEVEGLGVSIGVAAHPECGRAVEELLAAADRALYRAKALGRNRVVAAGCAEGREEERAEGHRPADAGAETGELRRTG
jgi:diguanylate cyclase (GGDEF)-like protein